MNASPSMLRARAHSDVPFPNFMGTECMTVDAPQRAIQPIIPPPAIYDHAYTGRLTVQQGTMAKVEYYCHTKQGIVSEYQALGCSNSCRS